MPASRFDAFTKRLATAPSRRAALRLLGGGLAGGVLAALRRRPASAQPPPPGGSPTLTSIRFVTPEPSTCGQATTIAFAVMSAGLPLPRSSSTSPMARA